MKGLSKMQVKDLYDEAAAGYKPGTGGARWCDSGGTLHAGKVPASKAGKYEGKAGTIKRSRKGSVTRNLNGRREYVNVGETALYYKV